MVHPRTGMLIIALVAALVAGSAFAGNPGDSVTVGTFLQDVAGTMKLSNATAEQAVTALRSQGFDIPAMKLDKKLTEGDVVAIGAILGQQVSSSTPANPFTRGDADRFLDTFGKELDPSAAQEGENTTRGEDKVDPRTKGKGKKKGLYKKSPSEPV